MPRALESTPEDAPKVPPAHEVFKNFPRPKKSSASQAKRGSSPQAGRVSFEEYEAVVSDRPEKLTEEQVEYRDAEGKEKCKVCWHFFTQGGGDRRTVCEIFRPSDDGNVEPEKVCSFFTPDGEEYPLLKEKAGQSKD